MISGFQFVQYSGLIAKRHTKNASGDDERYHDHFVLSPSKGLLKPQRREQ